MKTNSRKKPYRHRSSAWLLCLCFSVSVLGGQGAVTAYAADEAGTPTAPAAASQNVTDGAEDAGADPLSFTAQADGVTVCAAVPADGGIPADAVLHAERLEEGTGAHSQALATVRQALHLAAGDELYFAPLTVCFIDAAGQKHAPQSAVEVTMTFPADPFAAALAQAGGRMTERFAVQLLDGGGVRRPEPQNGQTGADGTAAFEAEPFAAEGAVLGPVLVIRAAGKADGAMPAAAGPQDILYVPAAPDGMQAAACGTVEDAVRQLANGGVICLTEDVSIDTVRIDGARAVTVRSYEGTCHTVTKSGSGESMLRLSGGAALTLENVALDAAQNTAGRTVTASGGASLTLGTGAVVENNTAFGAVALNDASLTVSGGTIRNNTSAENGGAVRMENGSTFTMTAGEVSGNAAQNGGAVYCGPDALPTRFTVSGGTFSANRAAVNGSILCSHAAQSAVRIRGGGTVFRGNTAAGSGGIYLDNSSGAAPASAVEIGAGASFENNEAQRGPCLYVVNQDGIRITIDGAAFMGNRGQWGGALYNKCSGANLTLKDSTFQSNRAEQGGGVFWQTVQYQNELLVDGCTFAENESGSLGGALGGHFRDGTRLTLRNSTFSHNTAAGSGGALYGSFENCAFTVDGGSFTRNQSGESGGGFMAFIADAAVTVTGDAAFTQNTADVNAGAFSVRRNDKTRPGTVYLLSANIDGNVCNADFSRYSAASDYLPTTHYNTGGIYIGENITCYMYDALVTGNYVETGYTGGTVGCGIGLCPNAAVFLYPVHGATVFDNGKAETMDILAVPWDETITHETPAKLYISDVTPDGQAYNWTDLQGGTARTGVYDWTNIRGGLAKTSARNGAYTGETTLAPVGFKANIQSARARAATPGGTQRYKVRITDNHTRSALYAAGGVMVNGTVVAGEFSVSVQKTVEVSGATAEKQNELKTERPYKFRFSIVDTSSGKGGSSTLTAPADPIPYTTANRESGTVTFQKGQTTLTKGEGGYDGDTDTFESLFCEFTLKGADTLTFGGIRGSEIGIDEYDTSGKYYFLLEELDSGGAALSEIVSPPDSGSLESGELVFSFLCSNTFEYGALELTKQVGGAAGEKERLWAFVLSFQTEQGGQALQGSFPVEITGAGVPASGELKQGGLTFENGRAQLALDANGRATVFLKDGQTLTVRDLPAGTAYTVTETEAGRYGYETTPSGAVGSIEKDATAEARYTNTRETLPTPTPAPRPTPTPPSEPTPAPSTPPGTSPRTGDVGFAAWWIALLALSCLGLLAAGLIYWRRRRKAARKTHKEK